jgi:hypothetical protein
MSHEPTQVACYSGHSYAQEPRTFTWQGEHHIVTAVERSWRSPSGPHFRVRTEDGACFELAYDELADEWRLVHLVQKSTISNDS